LGHAPALYDDLTVTENLRFSARMLGLADDARKLSALIASVSLSAAAHERSRTLSSGMQRRVALARLMMHAPSLLLLDEPYNSLDADGVDIVNALVAATRDAGGATLLVSHEPERVAHLADRVLSMDAGLLRDIDGDESPLTTRSLPFSPPRIAREATR
jgi:ABC-type multidrug transport system ATPase subunit